MNGVALVSLLVVGGLASAALASSEWHQFKAKHEKVYESFLEERMRYSIFMKNKQEVERFNKFESEDAGFELGLNHLSDWTQEEYDKLFGRDVEHSDYTNTAQAEAFLAQILGNRSEPLPDSVDYRDTERVSGVKNQITCAADWAFSVTGVLEGQELNVTKGTYLVYLSDQNLIDCVEKNNGCGASGPSGRLNALRKIRDEGGIVDEDSYEFTGATGKTCNFNKAKSVMTVSGFALLKEGDEQLLKEVVAKFGPVSVAIADPGYSWQAYRHGVYRSQTCKNDRGSLNHTVLIVGYGTNDRGVDYWIVKNSWDVDWGDAGYILMARNLNNMCGIATQALIPTFA